MYSPFTSPPITPRTSNKLKEVDSMGREWFETTYLQGRRAERVVMLRFTFNTKKYTKMGIFSQCTYLPRPRTPRMNRTRRIRLVMSGFGPVACVDGRPQVRLMYLILFFAHKNTDYKPNTHLLPPKMPWPLLRTIRKRGGAEGWPNIERRLRMACRQHRKVGFVSG